MFTDIVGYSQMVANDEKGALELLDEHNNIIFPIINNHDGEIIKLIGDAIFARYLSSKNSNSKSKYGNLITNPPYKVETTCN